MTALNPLTLGDRITLLPVIHGSAESALSVRRWMLEHPVDCLAVPIPRSFGPLIEQAITWLPTPSIVFQQAFKNRRMHGNRLTQKRKRKKYHPRSSHRGAMYRSIPASLSSWPCEAPWVSIFRLNISIAKRASTNLSPGGSPTLMPSKKFLWNNSPQRSYLEFQGQDSPNRSIRSPRWLRVFANWRRSIETSLPFAMFFSGLGFAKPISSRRPTVNQKANRSSILRCSVSILSLLSSVGRTPFHYCPL